jgi:hypothetical protein
VFGRWDKNGQIRTNWWVFGHEVLHCLFDDEPMIANPDTYFPDPDDYMEDAV